tara:strand:- start:315 stop:1640 length:1326 start_codon:yes stop_codon:yes gene_type:complete
MKLTIQEIAKITQGKVHGISDIEINGVSTDSRSLEEGNLFIPLIAERDGHDFIADAVEAGASAYLYTHGNPEITAIKVQDTMHALQSLAKYVRSNITGEVIGITGSVGKTSTKDIVTSCVSATLPIHASKLSHNNEIGVPLTILSTRDFDYHVVLEMGARGPGQIKKLCDIASPTIGIITQISASHTEFFNDENEITKTKGELIESLPPSGTAILNGDDPRVRSLSSKTNAEVLLYGESNSDVTAMNIAFVDNFYPTFDVRTPWGNCNIKLNIPGRHNISNALAAISCSLTLGVPLDSIAAALGEIVLSPMRMDLVELNDGTLIINDSYNANPASMSAALETVISAERENKLAILGLMAELGERSPKEHEEIGNTAKEAGIKVISVGVEEYGGVQVATWQEALELVFDNNYLGDDSIILIKGSRIVELEKLVDAIVESTKS